MLEFRNLIIEDKEWVNICLKKSNFQANEYSFSNNYIWSSVSNIKIAKFDNFCILMYTVDKVYFLFPSGFGDYSKLFKSLEEYCIYNNIDLNIDGITDQTKDILINIFKDRLAIFEDRDKFDYIYLSDDLINLKGKKYHSKRNHINRFKEKEWTFEKVSDKNIQECLDMNKDWIELNADENDDDFKDKMKEHIVVNTAIKNCQILGLIGGILRQENKIVGMSFGRELNDNTFHVLIEKAYYNIQGSYPTINREFIYNFAKDYIYVNREEDMGLEGLRKSKLSYNPVYLLKKYKGYIKV
ncbi:MAG: DUF2156 domain-containing protein [Oscillospiraceae bacterium]|nr:DUF2156 domain-containing protein [Oscillospiraceae bacterium]